MIKNNGIILINKPANYTSRDIVNIVSKKLKIKKVGHTGTLDPLAKGLLIILYGKYTKLGELLTNTDKEYIAEIKLGIKTDTLDITGEVLEKKEVKLTKDKIVEVLNAFKGLYHMEVPIYSAVKIKGKKLYEYARSNIEVTLPYKDVYIYDIKLLEYHDNLIKFYVKVQKGTYIRSLIKDICTQLNTIGTMNDLIRIKQGNFKIQDSYTLEEFLNDKYQVLDIRDVLDVYVYELEKDLTKKVLNGNIIQLDREDKYILFTDKGKDIALYIKDEDTYKCFILF